jgi:hypothetical protein
MVINNNPAKIATIYGMYNYASMVCICINQQTIANAKFLENSD